MNPHPQVLTPPYNGWETNLQEAFSAGALEAISEVLSRHAGDEGVLEACTACLRSMATDGAMAAQLVQAPVMKTLMQSVTEHPDSSSAIAALQLLDTAARSSPGALLQAGFVPLLTQLLHSSTHPPIKAACVHALERIMGVPGAGVAMLEHGTVAALSSLLASAAHDEKLAAALAGADTQGTHDSLGAHLNKALGGGAVGDAPQGQSCVAGCMTMLERLGRLPGAGDTMAAAGVMGVMQEVMAAPWISVQPQLVSSGGRIMASLARGNVATLLSDFTLAASASGSADGAAGGTMAVQTKFLGQLSVEPEIARRFVGNDEALRGLVCLLSPANAARQEGVHAAAADSVQSLCNTNALAAPALVRMGLITQALQTAARVDSSPSAVAGALRAVRIVLAHLSAVAAAEVMDTIACAAVGSALSEHAHDVQVFVELVRLLDTMSATVPHCTEQEHDGLLSREDTIQAVAGGLVLFQGHTELKEVHAAAAIRVLVCGCSWEGALGAAASVDGLAQATAQLAVASASSLDSTLAGVACLGGLMLHEGTAAACLEAVDLDALLAKCGQLREHAKFNTLMQWVKELLLVYDAVEVAEGQAGQTAQAATELGAAAAGEADMDTCAIAALRFAALCQDGDMLGELMGNGSLPSLLQLLRGTDASDGDLHGALAHAAQCAAHALAQGGFTMEEGAVDVSGTVRCAASLLSVTVASLRGARGGEVAPGTLASQASALRDIVLMQELGESAMQGGAVEACVAALRCVGGRQGENQQVQKDRNDAARAASDALLGLARQAPSESCFQTAQKGGLRQLLAFLRDNIAQQDMQGACEAAAAALVGVLSPLGSPNGHAQLQRSVDSADTAQALCAIASAGQEAYFPGTAGKHAGMQLFRDLAEGTRLAGAAVQLPPAVQLFTQQANQVQALIQGGDTAPLVTAFATAGWLQSCAGDASTAADIAAGALGALGAFVQDGAPPTCLGSPLLAALRCAALSVTGGGANSQVAEGLAAACGAVLQMKLDSAGAAFSLAAQVLALCMPLFSGTGEGRGLAEGVGTAIAAVQGGSTSQDALSGLLAAAAGMAKQHGAAVADETQSAAVRQWWQDAGQGAGAHAAAATAEYLAAAVAQQGSHSAQEIINERMLDDLMDAAERSGKGADASDASEAIAGLLEAGSAAGAADAAVESGCLHRLMQNVHTQKGGSSASCVAGVLRAAAALGESGPLATALARQALRQHGNDEGAVQAASAALGLDNHASAEQQLRQQSAGLQAAATPGCDPLSLANALQDMAALAVVPSLMEHAEASVQSMAQAVQTLLVGCVDGEPLGSAGSAAVTASLAAMVRLSASGAGGAADASTAASSICSLISLSIRMQHEDGDEGRFALQLQLAEAATALGTDPAAAAHMLLCGITADLTTIADVAQGAGTSGGAAAAAAAQEALKRMAKSAASGAGATGATLQSALEAARAAHDDELYRSIVGNAATGDEGQGALWGSLGGIVEAVGGALQGRREALRRGSVVRGASFAGSTKGSDAGEDAAVQATASAMNFGTAHAAVRGLLSARGLDADAVLGAGRARRAGQEVGELPAVAAADGIDESAASVLASMLVAADCAAVATAAADASPARRRNSSISNLHAAQQSSEDIYDMVTALLGQTCSDGSGFVFDGASATAFSLSGGVASLLAQLRRNMQHPGTVKSLTNVLLQLALTRSDAVLSDFAAPGAMTTLVACTALYSSGQAADGKGSMAVAAEMDIVQTCGDIMRCVTGAFAASRCGLEAGGMQALITAQRTAQAQGHGAAQQLTVVVESLSTLFEESELQVLTSLLGTLIGALEATLPGQALDPVQAMSNPDGTAEGLAIIETTDSDEGAVYFTDLVLEEVTWEAPTAYTAIRAALGPVQAAIKAQSMGMERVPGAVLSQVLHETAKIRRSGALVGDICEVLTAICVRADNLGSMLDDSETLSDVNVMQLCSALFACNLNQRHGLFGALGLMRRLATRASCRVTLFGTGVLELVGEYIWQAPEEEDQAGNQWRHDGPIVAAAARVATALCVGLPQEQQALVVSEPWLAALNGCLLQHCADGSTADRLVTVCRNVAALNAVAATAVSQHAGDGLSAVVGGGGDPGTKAPENAMQVLRYMCAQQENAETLVCGSATLVASLTARMQLPSLADSTAILACSVMDALGDVAPDSPQVQAKLTEDGGIQATIALLHSHAHSSDVIIAVCGALSGLLMDGGVVQGLHDTGVPLAQPLVDALLAFEWDVEVVTACFNAMIGAVDCDDVSAALLSAGVLERAIDAMDTYAEEELVVFALAVLTRVCEIEESLERVNARDGMRVLFHVLAAWSVRSKAVVKGSFRLLQRLTVDSSLVQSLANDGMDVFMGGMDAQMQHPDVLERGLQIIAELALSQNTFASILQNSGVQRITAAITQHPDDVNVGVEAIIALERIAMVSLEACEVVLDEGGKELVAGVMELHPTDKDIQVHGKSTIATMDALTSLRDVGDKVSGGAVSGDSAETSARDELLEKFTQQRSALLSGNAMLKWDKKGPKSVIVRCTEDFKSLLWLNVKTGQKLGAMDVAMFTGVTQGPGALHSKRAAGVYRAKTATPECCFWVDSPRRQLYFETTAAPQADRWASTLQLLIDVCRATKGKMTQ